MQTNKLLFVCIVMPLRFTRFVFTLALAALLLCGMLPSGYMPVMAARGMEITICTMYGPEKILVDANGKPLKENPEQSPASPSKHAADICPFHLAATGLLPLFIAPVLLPASYEESRAVFPAYAPSLQKFHYLNGHGARAPPILI